MACTFRPLGCLRKLIRRGKPDGEPDSSAKSSQPIRPPAQSSPVRSTLDCGSLLPLSSASLLAHGAPMHWHIIVPNPKVPQQAKA